MHLLVTQPGEIADGEEAVDLGQSPGEIVVLSAAASDLSLLANVRQSLGEDFPTLRLANLLQLSHNMSVDVYLEDTLAHAKLVVVRRWGALGIGRTGLNTSRHWPVKMGSSWLLFLGMITLTLN